MNIILLAGIADAIKNFITGFFGALLSIIPKTIYALCTLIFSIMDVLQILIRKVAGLDQIYYTSVDWTTTGGQSNDIVFNFIQNIFLGQTPILTNVFWAMMILGVVMLFITTLIAVLKSEYTMDVKASSKGKIIGQAFKAIFSFAVVPIVAFFGMYLANIILQAVDSATTSEVSSSSISQSNIQGLFKQGTSANGTKTYIYYNFLYTYNVPTTSPPISGMVFRASAYKANRIRYYPLFQNNLNNENVGAGVFNLLSSNLDTASGFLDDCFANSYVLKSPATLTTDPFKGDYLYPLGSSASYLSNSPVTFESFDKNNVSLVWYYYDLWSFDFIVCIAAFVIITKLLISLVFGLMKRIFELLILFLIAPPISALMPLDNGDALKKWRGKFISKAIGTYAPIAGMNLIFIIIPLISTIKFFNIPGIDYLVNILFIIVGLLSVKDLVTMISELTGADDTLKSGEGMAGEIAKTAVSVGKVAASPVRFAAWAGKTMKAAGKFGKDKITQSLDHKAEEGAVLNDIMGNEETASEFKNLSKRKQRKFLKKARLSMSDEDREKAHNEARIYRSVRRSVYGIAANNTDTFESADEIKKNKILKKENKAIKRQARNDDKNFQRNIASYTALDELTRSSDYKSAVLKTEKAKTVNDLFEKGEINNRQKTARLRNLKLTNDESIALKRKDILEKNIAKNSIPLKENGLLKLVGKAKNLVIDEKYKNFNARYFGAEGSAERQAAEQRIADRKVAEKKEYGSGKDLFKDALGNDFKETLKNIFKSMGGEFMKGWKEAGGFKAIANAFLGNEKKSAEKEEIKNQVKILKAQMAAQALVGGKNKESASAPIDINPESINLLADEIAKRLK